MEMVGPPPWSVPIIDGINSKAWQLLGDSLGKQELLVLADHGGRGTEAMWRPIWRRENEKRKEKSRFPPPPPARPSALLQHGESEHLP